MDHTFRISDTVGVPSTLGAIMLNIMQVLNFSNVSMAFTIIISLFTSIILLRELSLSYRIKSILKLDQFKSIKLIDCFPCCTFWISIITLLFTNENII